MADDLAYGVKLTGDGSSLRGEVKSSYEEMANLKKATDDLAISAKHLAEGQMGMSIAESNSKDKAWALANGYKEVDGQLIKVNKATAEAAHLNAGMTRELMVLGHEAMTGNFARIPGSLMVLASRSGLASSGMIGMAAAIAAPVVALGTLAVAIHEGAAEMEAMNRAIAMTGDYSGQTTNSLRAQAEQMSATSQLTIGQSKEMSIQLAASGKIGEAAFDGVAAAVAAYARASGEHVDKVTTKMVKLFADPAKGAAELNSTMHFLNVTQLEHIQQLEREGNVTQAQVLLAELLNDKLSKQEQHVGFFGKAWNSLAKAASGAWDSMESLGRPDTIDEKIAKINARINAWAGNEMHIADIKQLQIERDELLNQKAQERSAASAAAADASMDRTNIETLAIAKQNSELWKTYETKVKIARVSGGDMPTMPSDAAVRADAQRTLDGSKKLLEEVKKFDEAMVESGKDAFTKRIDGWVKLQDEMIAKEKYGATAREAHEAAYTAFVTAESDKRIADAAKEKEAKDKHLAAQLESEQAYWAEMSAAAGEATQTAESREMLRFEKDIINLEKRRAAVAADHPLTLAEIDKFEQAKLDIIRAHQNRQMSEAASVVNFDKQLRAGNFTHAMSMAQQMTAGLATHSRAAFEINKVASQANIIVTGIQATSDAYKYGMSETGSYWGGLAYAAVTAAWYAAQLSAVNSTSFGGGGGAPSAGSGVPSLATTPGTPVNVQPPPTGTAAPAAQNVSITIVGNEATMFTYDQIVNQLIPAINAAAGNGVNITVNT